MQKIEYYRFELGYFRSDSYWYREEQKPYFYKNYQTKEIALAAVEKSHELDFNPEDFYVEFTNAKIFKEVEVEIPIFSSRKNKSGVPKIIGHNKEKHQEVVADYTDFIPEAQFKSKIIKYKDTGYQCDKPNGKGFYKFKFSDFVIHKDVEKGTICWKAQVFVQFVEAITELIKEVKEAGKPYQPQSVNVATKEVTDWLPIYTKKELKDPYNWNNRDKITCFYMKEVEDAELYFLETNCFELEKKELEIVDSL